MNHGAIYVIFLVALFEAQVLASSASAEAKHEHHHESHNKHDEKKSGTTNTHKTHEAVRKHSMGVELSRLPPFAGEDKTLANAKGKVSKDVTKGETLPIVDRGIGIVLANYPPSAKVDTKQVNRKGKKLSSDAKEVPLPMDNRGMGIIFANYPHSAHRNGLSKDEKESSKKQPTSGKSIGMELLRFPPFAGIGKKLGLGDSDSKLPTEDIKTKQNKTTKIHGNYKTVTIFTQQFRRDKENKTKMIGQSVETVTTPLKGALGKKKPAGLFFSDMSPFGFFDDAESEPQCSAKKPCKKKGTYCNKQEGQCEATKKPGSKCDQPDQCSAHGGKKYICVWGSCSLASNAGYSGRFCSSNKECGSEDMQCVPQSDVSRVSDICISKPSEGQTCGQKVTFGFWPFKRSMMRKSPCKKGLKCVAIGYSGRMVCLAASSLNKEKESNS